MNLNFKKGVLVFIVSLLVIAIPLFLFPINLFPGEYVLKDSGVVIEAPISLYSFTTYGYDPDMQYFSDFYLTTKGYAFAACLLIGIPFLIAYRISLIKKTS